MSTTWTFQGLQSGDLDFGTIDAVEQDIGLVLPFYGVPAPQAASLSGLSGIWWSGYQFGIVGPNSSLNLTLGYTITDTNPSEAISSVAQYFNANVETDPADTTATAVENVYTAPGGQLLGSSTWSLASGALSSIVNLSGAYQQVYVTVTLNESINSNGSMPGPSGPGSELIMSILGQFYGETPVASISGFVFCDENGSGVYAGSDFGMSGVTVDLLNSGGTVVASTVTNVNGNYSFGDLAAGTYTTQVIAPAGDTITANGTTTVNLTSGESYTAPNTGLDMPAVWNVNVEFDSGGTYINYAGATVTLETGAGAVVNYGTTNGSGDITFTGLTPGDTYKVEVTTPAGTTVESSINVDTSNEVISCGTVSSSEILAASNTGGGGGSPAVTIVKSVTTVGGVAGDGPATFAGEAIDYQVVVTNTGNENLTDVLVTDPTLGITFATLASLAVGASVTYTAVQTVTQAEIDNGGPVFNTAVVTDDQTPSQTSSVTTPVSQSPSVTIVKSVTSVGGAPGDPAATKAGEVIDYQVVVGNTGNETLTNVLVTDPTLSLTLGSLASLAVGGTVTYTATQTVTQAEIDSGKAVPNTAVVTDTQTSSQTSSVTTPVSQSPSVTIVKSVTSVGGVAGDPAATKAGEVIDYQVVVTNTGNETLTNVLVTDPTLSLTLGSLASLAVGGAVTYTAAQTVTAAELNSGNSIPNTAVVTDTQTSSQTSTVTTPVSQSPGISIVKSVTSVGGVAGDPAATYAGEVIDYNIVVTNTGSETLTNVVVKDTTLGITLGTLASLAVGASVTYTAAQTVTQADLNQILGTTTGCGGSVTHTGPSSGCGAGSTAWLCSTFNPTSCSNGATYTFSGITCTISGQGVGGTITEQCPNAVITFSSSCSQPTTTFNSSTNCWVTTLPANCNPGSIFLSGLPFTVPSGCNLSNCNITWSIGQSGNNCGASNVGWDFNCTAFNNFDQSGCNGLANYNQIGVQSCDNLGGWSYDGYSTCAGTPLNQYVSGNCSSTNFIQSCGSGNSCGGCGSCSCTTPPTNCSGSSVINTATVTDSQGVTGTSTVSTTVSFAPSVSIVKTVTSVGGVCGDPAATYAGEAIDYQIVVTNTGDEALTNVVVKDTTLGTTLGTIATLAVGASATYTAAQTVTQAEINSGNPILNTATVTDSQTPSQSSTATTAVAQMPGVSIVKTVTSVGGVAGDPTATAAGEVINYKVVVSNTGNETLTNVVVTDTTLGTTLGTLASLAVGASATYTTSTTVTSAELKAGSPVLNTATVTDSQTPSASSTVSTNVGSSTGISVIKLPNDVVVGSCGQVTYTFDVTNTGTTPLTNVVLTDNIGTASNPNYISPVLQTTGTNGTLAAGQTWVYTATINQAGDYNSNGGSQSCSVSGHDLTSGCTAWLNSSFKPTSCANGATYTFQDITCTIKGPNCGTITLQVPNACITFSSSCKTPTTTFDASQNCWITTLPANCNPGNVFLSGLPYQIPSGCNLSGATISWNIAGSANNCGSSSINWQAGCSGYSSFNNNSCNGLTNYNQIGVQVCDNSSCCGSSGSSGSNGYCAGTPQNQYSYGNCGSYGYGSGSNSGGTCGNGSSSGSTSCAQLATSSEADTATVTAMACATGSGGSLTAATILQDFNAVVFGNASTSCDIEGGIVVGGNFSGATVYDQPSGSLPSGFGALTVFGSTSGNSITLDNGGNAYVAGSKGSHITFNGGGGYIGAPSASIGTFSTALDSLSQSLSALSATGTLPATGNNEVITATPGANGIAVIDMTASQLAAIPSFSINLNGASTLVLNVSGTSATFNANDESGTTGAGNIIWNFYQATGTVAINTQIGGTVLAPTATVTNSNQINGDLVAQSYSGSGELHDVPFTGNLPSSAGGCTTVSASDSTEVQVLASNSSVTLGGSTPTGSLTSLYGTAEKLEFTYSPGNTVSLVQNQAAMASVTGSNSNSMAFLEISNNSNPYASNATIYFEGEVQSGEEIFADATLNQLTNTPVAAPNNHFSTTSGADIYAYVFASQAAFQNGASPIQTMVYNASGSQNMHLGDTIGSLQLVGYVGANGGHLIQ